MTSITATELLNASGSDGGGNDLANDLAAAVGGSGYSIQFAGGQGVFSWSPGSVISGAGGNITITATGDHDDDGPGSAATYDSTPTPGSHSECTDHFTVTGAVSGSFNGT